MDNNKISLHHNKIICTRGEALTTCWLVVLSRIALGKPLSTLACCCCFADDIGTAISFIAKNTKRRAND